MSPDAIDARIRAFFWTRANWCVETLTNHFLIAGKNWLDDEDYGDFYPNPKSLRLSNAEKVLLLALRLERSHPSLSPLNAVRDHLASEPAAALLPDVWGMATPEGKAWGIVEGDHVKTAGERAALLLFTVRTWNASGDRQIVTLPDDLETAAWLDELEREIPEEARDRDRNSKPDGLGMAREPVVASPSARKGEWLARAMILVRDHPEWSDRRIAQETGVDPGTLSRSAEYQVAAKIARESGATVARGFVVRDVRGRQSGIEAIDR